MLIKKHVSAHDLPFSSSHISQLYPQSDSFHQHTLFLSSVALCFHLLVPLIEVSIAQGGLIYYRGARLRDKHSPFCLGANTPIGDKHSPFGLGTNTPPSAWGQTLHFLQCSILQLICILCLVTECIYCQPVSMPLLQSPL